VGRDIFTLLAEIP